MDDKMNKIIILVGIIMLVMVQSVSAGSDGDDIPKGEFIGDWEGGSPAIDTTAIVILVIAVLSAIVIMFGIVVWLHYKSMQLEKEKRKSNSDE